MKRYMFCVVFFVFTFGIVGISVADTINFDDAITGDISALTNPYKGFNWYRWDYDDSQWYAMRVLKDDWYYATYNCDSLVFPSIEYVAYGEGGGASLPAKIRIEKVSGKFTFVSAKFARYCHTEVGADYVTVTSSAGHSQNIASLSQTSFKTGTFNWEGLTWIQIEGHGDYHLERLFLFDDFVFSAPSTANPGQNLLLLDNN